MTITGQRGFTLVEMLVVLAIMALLATFSPLLIDGVVPRLRTEAAARELADTMRQARAFAVRDNRARFVLVDVGARVAVIGGETTRHDLPQDVQIKLVVARVEQVDAESGRIRFFPDGTSTGGKVVLNSPERTLTVVVDWFDGRVRVVDEPVS